MKNRYFSFVVLLLTLILCVAIAGSLFGILKKVSPEELSHKKITSPMGLTVDSYSVEDMQGVHKITPLHTANRFLSTDVESLQNNYDKPAKRGTFTFVIANIKPTDEKFNEKAESLSFLKGKDDCFHLTMYIPPVLSACNIYVKNVLCNQIGEIENYKYVDFIPTDQTVSVKHANATEPVFLDISLTAKRKLLDPEDELYNACIVTIHYECESDKLSGFDGDILIGEDRAVRKLTQSNGIGLYIIAIISALGLSVLVFLSFLKKQIKFVPKIISVFSVFLLMIASYLYSGLTEHPYLLLAMKQLAFSSILIAEAMHIKLKIKGLRLKYPLLILAVVNAVIALVTPQVSLDASGVLSVISTVMSAVLIVLIPTVTLVYSFTQKDKDINLGSMIAPVLIATALFESYKISLFSTSFYIVIFLLFANLYIFFKECVLTEKRALLLTNNLNGEVERQTEDLKSLLSERDKILNYISHDLRKPVVSIKRFLKAVQDAPDEASRKTALSNLEIKVQSLDEGFNEVSRVAKNNYSTETAKEIELSRLFKSIYEELNPDCEAEGILFQYSTSDITVFAKEFALREVLQNLIFNAVEHSDCTNLFLLATKNKTCCTITLTDNGKGIDADSENIFEPLVSENPNSDNLGLGLYICKHFIETMNGTLSFSSVAGKTEFIITLPRAE